MGFNPICVKLYSKEEFIEKMGAAHPHLLSSLAGIYDKMVFEQAIEDHIAEDKAVAEEIPETIEETPEIEPEKITTKSKTKSKKDAKMGDSERMDEDRAGEV